MGLGRDGTFCMGPPVARFSKAPIINGSVKLLLFTCKREVSIVLHLTNETKWNSLLARTPFLESAGNFSGPKSIIQIKVQRVRAGPLIIGAFEKRAPGLPPLLSVLRFEYLISGPKVTGTFEKRGP